MCIRDRVSHRAVHAELVREVRGATRLGEHRRVELDAHQRPGPARDEREVSGTVGRPSGHRHPDDGRRGVVRADGHHRQRAVVTDLSEQVVADLADHRSRFPERGQQARVDAEPLGEVGRPAAAGGVEQSGGRCVGDLRTVSAGEPVGKQVRDEQQPVRGGELGGAGGGEQLVDGVELLHLQTRPGVQLVGRNRAEGPLGHPVRARVTVVDRVAEQGAVGVEQPVVDRPGVDAVGIDSWAVDYGLLDADGALLGNPVHYRDPRTDGVPERAFGAVPADELYARTGLQVQQFNTVYQLLSAAGTAQLAAAHRLLLIPDLLAYWLTGADGAEVTNASTTGLLDATSRSWATDLAERFGIDPGLLPALREPGSVIGQIRDDLLGEIGHHGPLPVVAVGSHDTASAVVGVPVTAGPADGAGDFAFISCGTWSLVGVELDAPVLTEASRAANFSNELGVDGTVRYLRNVMGLWLLQESLRLWERDGDDPDLPTLLAAAAREPALVTVVDIDDAAFLPPGDMPARIAAASRVGSS